MIFSLGSFSHLSDPSRSPSLCFHCILLPINALATLYFKIFIMKSQSQKNSTILQWTLIHSQQLITFYHICFLSQYVCVCVCARVHRWWWCLVTRLCLTLFWPHGLQTAKLLCPWDFPGKNIWGGLSCPPPKDLPNLGIKLTSPVSKHITGSVTFQLKTFQLASQKKKQKLRVIFQSKL